MTPPARLVAQCALWSFLLGVAAVWFSPLLRASSGCAPAGHCYIRAGAQGRATGANWTDAYTGFGPAAGQVDPARMQRGATYWIAAGNYGSVAFSTPDRGASVITVMGATPDRHGPASDWKPSYAGQALFMPSSITTDDWTFDGQTRHPDWQSGYTLKFWNERDPQGFSLTLGTYQGGVHHIRLQYLELQGTGLTGGPFPRNSTADRCDVDNCGQWMDGALKAVQPCSDIYVGFSYAHHTGNSQFWLNNTGPHASISQNLTWELNWISTNHTGQNGQHDEAFSLLANQVTIRHNVFHNIAGSGIIVDASAARPALADWFVYGNLFFNDPAYLALGQRHWLNTVDQGIVVLGDGDGAPHTEKLSGTFLFANNTIAHFDPPGASCLGTYSTLPIAGTSMLYGSPRVIIENNLWFRSFCVYGNYSPVCTYLSGSCTQDYNASYAGGLPAAVNWKTLEQPAPHDANVAGNADPFVDSSGITLDSFRLAETDPFGGRGGAVLGFPFDVDLRGTLRGADGVWDFGALEANRPRQNARSRPSPEPSNAHPGAPSR